MYIVPGSPSCAFALCVSGSGAEGEEEEEEEEEQQQQQQQQEEEDGSLDEVDACIASTSEAKQQLCAALADGDVGLVGGPHSFSEEVPSSLGTKQSLKTAQGYGQAFVLLVKKQEGFPRPKGDEQVVTCENLEEHQRTKNDAKFNMLHARLQCLAHSALAYIRYHYGSDNVDCERRTFTHEVHTQKFSSWSGHGPKSDGSFALPEGEDFPKDVEEASLVHAAKGQYSLQVALAHIRLVLWLLSNKYVRKPGHPIFVGDLFKTAFKAWDTEVVTPCDYPSVVHTLTFEEMQLLGFRKAMLALLAYSIEPHRWKADTMGIIDTLDMLTQMPGLLPDKPSKVFKLLLMKIGWSMVMFFTPPSQRVNSGLNWRNIM